MKLLFPFRGIYFSDGLSEDQGEGPAAVEAKVGHLLILQLLMNFPNFKSIELNRTEFQELCLYSGPAVSAGSKSNPISTDDVLETAFLPMLFEW